MGRSNNLGKLSNMITSTGSAVGIGTTSPNFILDVKQATNQHFYVGAGITVSGAIVLGGGNDAASANIPIEMRYATTFAFVDGGTERMRITSGGNLLVGTTDDTGNFKLKASGIVAAMGSNCSLLFQNRSSTNTYEWYATSGTIYNYSSAAAANILQINGSTGVYTPLSPSDSRLKDNIINYNRGLSELLKLEVKEWEYNGKAGTNAGEKTIGFVADQIINVIPEWVLEYDVKLEESDEEKTQVKRIITNDLQYLLVKAVQELSAQNQDLKSRLDKAGL